MEIALPWAAIKPYPRSRVAHRTVPPKAGDAWRLGLYRLDRPRADPSVSREARISKADAQALLGLPDEAALEALVAANPRLEFDADQTLNALHTHYARSEEQAWAPTRDVSFHVPRWFGVLRFVE